MPTDFMSMRRDDSAAAIRGDQHIHDMKSIFFALAVMVGATSFATPEVKAQAAPPSASPSNAIVSVQTGQCFDVTGYSTTPGAVIQLYPCTGTTNQMWAVQVFAYNGNAQIARIVNVNSGLCVSAESSTPSNGVIGLNQRACDVNDTLQQFDVGFPYGTVSVNSGQFTISVNSYNPTRIIRNIGTNWYLRTQPGFGRPYLVSSYTPSSDFQFRVSGI